MQPSDVTPPTPARQCVVLSGGLGTRLGELGRSRPKHLVEVLGRPFAHRQLEWLATQGVTEVVECIGHLGDAIRAELGDGSPFGLSITYSDDGDATSRPGTGGALLLAHRRGLLHERFCVLYGDSWLRLDLRALWEAAGAQVETLDAAQHDRVFAAVSHLPHLAAFALVDELAQRADGDTFFRFAASGFRDFTRIAGSAPEMWRDIALANREAVLTELDAYVVALQSLRQAVAGEDADALLTLFSRARSARENWMKKQDF